MTIQDYVGIAQALILLMTAVIILYYTVETVRIRKETSKQNALLAEQLLVMQKGQEFTQRKEMSFVEPVFSWEGISRTGDEAIIHFENKGGQVKNLTATAKADVSIRVTPSQFLGTGEKGNVKVRGENLSEKTDCRFDLVFVDVMGNS